MKLTSEEMAELARACRLSLTDAQSESYRVQLEALTEMAAPLLELAASVGAETENTELTSFAETGEREDRALSCYPREALLASAPHVRDYYAAVPRTVEEG